MESSTGLKTLQLNDQKAGMQGLDKAMINKVIFESSKGTSYFSFQEKRQKSIDSKVNELKSLMQKVSEAEKSASLKKMNAMGQALEAERDLSRSIVHIDMDAFYAAVEMESDPSLQGKPMAVGSLSMLSTSNYEARKYGVRAAMPGFIAKKLCPQLVIVPCDFDKYRRVSHSVRAIVQEYDPEYCPASLDEMYLDLTQYISDRHQQQLILQREAGVDSLSGECLNDNLEDQALLPSREQRDRTAFYIVQEIRKRIYEATNLTASAGIAPNVMLAKVGSDQNKPNGQFQVESTVEAVFKFISTLPVKKVSGIGPVQGQILNAIGIETCLDMWEKRDLVDVLFSDTSAEFYIRVALGIGSTTVKSNYVRKSIGAEQTFREIHDSEALHKKCHEICAEVVDDMKSRNLLGKVVVLKYKTTLFESHTRNHTLSMHSDDLDIIYNAAKRMLDSEISSITPKKLCLRLMGIRLANVVEADTVQRLPNIKDFLRPQGSGDVAIASSSAESKSAPTEGGRPASPAAIKEEAGPPPQRLSCPICCTEQGDNLMELNAHVDSCLNKIAIKEILAEDRIKSKRKREQDKSESVGPKMKSNVKKIKDYFSNV